MKDITNSNMKDVLDLSGTEVAGIDFDDDLAGLGVNTLLVHASSSPPGNNL